MVSHRSHRGSPQPGLGRGARVTVLSAAAGAAAAMTAAPVGAEPGEPSTATLNARVDRLYEQAERATEKYNAAAERVARLRGQAERAQDRTARGQSEVNRMREALASMAGAQYRSGGVDPTLALMLSEDPDNYLNKAAALDRISSRQSGKLRELQRAQRFLGQERTEAAQKLVQLEEQRKELKKHKKSVQRKLRAAQRLLNQLAPEEREERQRASRQGDRSAPELAGTGAPSARAAVAVGAAQRALGSPYAWGQAGPHGFDCSGLTQWAYQRAGVSLPRTSQAQAYAGQRVPMSQARPGDLVVYRGDASHIAMYVGNGRVIHSPYPGARVRYDPVNMMPVNTVTRP
ncbi:NlpC/P60 family protein [Streptomyces gobiensis]|uniref:C40 family peptidase n=1 Tax=Streptomyces gobiensis TaxID=2875706 RepID=UPI001E3758B6|nr:C40 family peptidase [Streptomyces gobiensis]UGY90923.1 NlpC/P60 family protein [Streptomyces gobiensis]